jgi:hypothetical protein
LLVGGSAERERESAKRINSVLSDLGIFGPQTIAERAILQHVHPTTENPRWPDHQARGSTSSNCAGLPRSLTNTMIEVYRGRPAEVSKKPPSRDALFLSTV